MARNTPLHEGGACKELDVMVARTVDLRRAKSVGRVLGLLESQTQGLVEPVSIGELMLPMFGGPLLKRAVLERGRELRKSGRYKRDSTVVSADKMQQVSDALTESHDFLPLTMKVASLETPFEVDDQDRLVVQLDDANRQYQKEGKAILNAMCELAGGATQAEILATDYFRPPEIVIGHVNRHALRFGDEQHWFAEDPNGFILHKFLSDKSITDDIDDPVRLFTKKVTFGSPVVVARPIEPSHMHVAAKAESPYDIRFDGVLAVKESTNPWDEDVAS